MLELLAYLANCVTSIHYSLLDYNEGRVPEEFNLGFEGCKVWEDEFEDVHPVSWKLEFVDSLLRLSQWASDDESLFGGEYVEYYTIEFVGKHNRPLALR